MSDNAGLLINSVRAEVGVIAQDGLCGIVRPLDILGGATFIPQHFYGSTRSRKLRGNMTRPIVDKDPARGRRQSRVHQNLSVRPSCYPRYQPPPSRKLLNSCVPRRLISGGAGIGGHTSEEHCRDRSHLYDPHGISTAYPQSAYRDHEGPRQAQMTAFRKFTRDLRTAVHGRKRLNRYGQSRPETDLRSVDRFIDKRSYIEGSSGVATTRRTIARNNTYSLSIARPRKCQRKRMFDVIVALQKVLDRSAKKAISDWLAPLPKGAAWHVISDYVFGDPDRHETASFVLLLHHGKLETILGYIDNQAPVDIKKSRSASEGLIRYLTSPVAFSFTFILDDGDKFLATYAPVSEMIDGLQEINSIAASMDTNTGYRNPYFSQVQKRLTSFTDDLKHKGNAKLARQVFLVAAYAAVVLNYLDLSAEPSHVSWVSDRDAILQRHDGIVWDLATIMFYMIKGDRDPVADGELIAIDKPKLLHISPDESGKNYLDPLIRMPDYLAAAASDMNLHTFEFSHPKLASIGSACFSQAANSVLCTLSWTGDGFLVRRLGPEEL